MIYITGGTGFVGRHLVARLLSAGEQARLLARRPADIPGAQVVQGDVTDPSSFAESLKGCRAVIHLVGIIRETRRNTFKRVHVVGTQNVVAACKEAGVTRLLYMSALGARPEAPSRYHRSKWEAEEIVRGSGLEGTIFRPSVIFGEGDSFLPQIRDLLTKGPAIPVIGNGMSLSQPIWVEDVVSCFVDALGKPETIGRFYQLGGPETYGFEQLIDFVAEADGVEKQKIHLPPILVRPVAAVMSRLSRKFPLTPDQLTMLLEDNICDIAEMQETFGLSPAFLRDHLSD
jgi:uncharacterized protein YbjT (DUF2867 family)